MRAAPAIAILAAAAAFAAIAASFLRPNADASFGATDGEQTFAEFAARRSEIPALAARRSADLDGDGREETVTVVSGRVRVEEEGGLSWESPAEWWVDDAAAGDATNDGVPDLSLSVWKEGDFGPSRPFWTERNDPRVRNHLFVFAAADGTLRPLWQSSNLEAPNCDIAVVDTDGDGKPDLKVVEGDYADWPFCEPRYDAVWKWNGWGFANERREALGAAN